MQLSVVDPKLHYKGSVGPIEHEELDECAIDIRNIGWTLGNDCPYRCTHCYSMSAREKGMNLTPEIIERIVNQLALNGVETVNLGGNEPLFTNGPNPKATLLPSIIDQLTAKGIRVGLTTSGVTLIHLERDHKEAFLKLNDVDVSFDSPYKEEHNNNRGANLFTNAVRTAELCRDYGIEHTVIMCAMSWNFTDDRIRALVNIAKGLGANIRINTLKPVEPKHMDAALSVEQFYNGFSLLMNLCDQVDLGEPPLATVTNYENAKGCPCGRTSFRIHSITPDGEIPVSPCVYLHDYKTGNLAVDDLYDIVRTPQFKTFRRRNAHPEAVLGCDGCSVIESCRGGCAARSYLYNLHKTGNRSLFVKDPYCPKDTNPCQVFPHKPKLPDDLHLVHRDYLCTWIGRPK
jgi:radical SAM protein with 4Fe4S-binding SPASM domain